MLYWMFFGIFLDLTCFSFNSAMLCFAISFLTAAQVYQEIWEIFSNRIRLPYRVTSISNWWFSGACFFLKKSVTHILRSSPNQKK